MIQGWVKKSKSWNAVKRENEQRDQDGFDRCRDNQQEHLSEDELDEEFWIKAKTIIYELLLCNYMAYSF